MSTTRLLEIASVLSILTCLGHTAGTFMPIPTEQTEHVQVYETMQRLVVPMPLGPVRSYAQIFLGTNLAVSLLLMLIGITLFILRKDANRNRIMLALNGVALLVIAGISALYFFPLPAIFTVLSGVLTVFSAMSSQTKNVSESN